MKTEHMLPSQKTDKNLHKTAEDVKAISSMSPKDTADDNSIQTDYEEKQKFSSKSPMKTAVHTNHNENDRKEIVDENSLKKTEHMLPSQKTDKNLHKTAEDVNATSSMSSKDTADDNSIQNEYEEKHEFPSKSPKETAVHTNHNDNDGKEIVDENSFKKTEEVKAASSKSSQSIESERSARKDEGSSTFSVLQHMLPGQETDKTLHKTAEDVNTTRSLSSKVTADDNSLKKDYIEQPEISSVTNGDFSTKKSQ